MSNQQTVRTVYQTVVDDVINGVREAFLDEGMDEQVLLELKQLWDSKLLQSKAVEPQAVPVRPDPVVHSYPAHPASLRATTHQQQQKQQVPPQQLMQQQQVMQQQQRQPMPQQLQQQRQPMPQQNMMQQHQQLQQQRQPVSQQQLRQPMLQQQQPSHLMPSVSQTLAPPPAHVHPPPAHQGQIHRIAPSQQINLTGPSTFNPAHSMNSAAGAPQTTIQLQLPPGVYQAADGRFVGQGGGVLQLMQQPSLQQQQRVGSSTSFTIGAMTSQGTDPNVKPQTIFQIDGLGDSSSEEEEDDDDDDDEQNDENDEVPGEEEEPLNSSDDVSDTDPTEVFEAENVVVCQFDKINRSKNKWKFHLKDGIMNLNGKDYVFQKANGDAEW